MFSTQRGCLINFQIWGYQNICSLFFKISLFGHFLALLAYLLPCTTTKSMQKRNPWCFSYKGKFDRESVLWSKHSFFLSSLVLGGVDLLDKIKAFLDHLWKMAIFSDAIVDINHHLLQIWTSYFAENSEHRKTAQHL